MTRWITIFFLLIFLLSLLKKKDINDGEKELFKHQQWRPIDIVTIILLFNTTNFLFYYVLIDYVINSTSLIKGMYLYASHILVLLFLFAYFKFRLRQNIKVLGFKFDNLFKAIGYGLVAGFIINFIGINLLKLFGKETNFWKEMWGIDTPPISFNHILFFFLVIFFAPFVEELVFRGLLYSTYRKKYGAILAVLITSFIFVTSHPDGGFILAPIMFCLLYEKTESILSPIVSHCIVNFLGIYWSNPLG